MSLADMEQAGALVRGTATPQQLKAHLAGARHSLVDASNPAMSPDSALTIGWLAIARLAQCALLDAGYRVAGSADRHTAAIDSLEFTLGYAKDKRDALHALKDKRNAVDYELAAAGNADVAACLSAAHGLLSDVVAHLQQRHPQLRA